ncbi:hypothetical protein HK098_008169 [Nowakowskiella sp. JEL0407]|nr:hypothetical protein HK098_008169 [Nowakowskiella sp. JEL0407]
MKHHELFLESLLPNGHRRLQIDVLKLKVYNPRRNAPRVLEIAQELPVKNLDFGGDIIEFRGSEDFELFCDRLRIATSLEILNWMIILPNGCRERFLKFMEENTHRIFPINILDLVETELKQPRLLFASSGAKWMYQFQSLLYEKLKPALDSHFENFSNNITDKSEIPTYYYISGAGTGKSRNANRLKNSFVFRVSFSNRTPRENEEKDLSKAVGIRMLSQLLTEKSFEHVFDNYEAPSPSESLMRFTGSWDANEAAFHNGLSKVVSAALHGSLIFICFTSSIPGFLNKSANQEDSKRVYLPDASLSPPIYIDNSVPAFSSNRIVQMLVSDGRALESLKTAILGKNINEIDRILLSMRRTRKMRSGCTASYHLRLQYPEIARVIFERARLKANEKVSGTPFTPEEIARSGLISFERADFMEEFGYLKAPCAWFILGNDLLTQNKFSGYWASFDEFVAFFRTFKANLYSDEKDMSISKIHRGAKLKRDLLFKNHHVVSTITKAARITSSHDYKHCFLTRTNAKTCNVYLSLDTADCKRFEIVHCGFYHHAQVTREMFAIERDKDNWEEYFGPLSDRAMGYF